MADIFCDFTSGLDSDDGSTRALAKQTLAAALTAAGAGGRVGVKSTSAETATAAVALTSPGTAASPTQILSIDWTSDTFGSNALAAGFSLTTLSGGANRHITFAGFAYCYGGTFKAGDGANGADLSWQSTSPWYWNFDTCALQLGNSSSGSRMNVGSSSRGTTKDQRLELNNTPLSFGHASQAVLLIGEWYWSNTPSGVAGTVPTTLVLETTATSGLAKFSGVDLSGMGSGNIFSLTGAGPWYLSASDCKLGASAVLGTGSIAGQGGVELDIVNCDSADTNYRYQKQRYQGTITQETTIVRTGGASDGTTSISRKLASTANSKIYSPLTFDIVFWNESLSALSLAAEVVSDGVTFTDAELWMEVVSLNTSGVPLSGITSDRAIGVLSSPANQTSSSIAWTTTGLSSPTKQKLEVSVTPAEKGRIRCRICLAKASSTVYVCPLITGLGFTSGRQWQGDNAYVLEGASGGAATGNRIIGG